MRKTLLLIALCVGFIVTFAGDWPSQNARGGIGFSFGGLPPSSTEFCYLILWATMVPTNYAGSGPAVTSQCACQTAPTSSWVLSIAHVVPGVSSTAEGNCTIAGSANVGTFASAAQYLLQPGDMLCVTTPTRDATAASCGISIGVSQ